ncbi:MAG: AmmeMemoRadiSam system protein A [Ketobacter sp.]
MTMDKSAQQELLDTAWASIHFGLHQHKSLPVTSAKAGALNQSGASFITLQKHHQLRGCMGSLEAYRSLLEDVADNAYSAAFRDPRFAPLTAAELDQLDLQISVLSKPVPMQFVDEVDLLNQLQPGLDGIVFESGEHRSTFLPQVWERLTTPRQFMAQLKQKAGLSADYWAPQVRIKRYHVEKFR